MAEVIPTELATTDFEASFDELWTAAYRVAFRLLGDREEARDCAQDACVRAYVRWQRVTRGGHPTPWVVRVASNLAIDRWRSTQRARSRAVSVESSIEVDQAKRVDIHRALGALPKRQRDVVVLRYLADLTERETAAILGISLGAVKQHASRGLTALRSLPTLDEGDQP